MPLDGPPSDYPIAFPADGLLVDDPVTRATSLTRSAPSSMWCSGRLPTSATKRQRHCSIPRARPARLVPLEPLRASPAPAFQEPPQGTHPLAARGPFRPLRHLVLRPSPDIRQSLRLSRDLVAPKLDLEERRRTNLVQEAGPNPTARQRVEIAAQDSIVDELRAFAEEVGRVAPLWDPVLDDGIVLASAPLWRLIPHRAWQKELRSRWDDLAAGKYDWAHLAMHLWPERVVPKCADDRNLAIAHDLEDVFWVEGAEGK